jgi:predicted nucleotidyltransferase
MARIFFDKYGYGKPFTYIHPFKQKAVKHVVDNVPDSVKMIIVFGSSVTDGCGYDSDIDLCVIGNPTADEHHNMITYKLGTEGLQPFDVLSYKTLAELVNAFSIEKFGIEREILLNGVRVYDSYIIKES